MKRIFTYWIGLCFLLAGAKPALAQNYPVLVNPVLSPPASMYLGDYTRPDDQRLQLHILLQDLTHPAFDASLRITITGGGITLRTRPEYQPRPFMLEGGVPVTLTGADLAGYLDPRNMQIEGISPQAFGDEGKLPDGMYQLRFEVLDYNRGTLVSNPGMAVLAAFRAYPPVINQPFDKTTLRGQFPQNILFQWTPRHMGAAGTAFNVFYTVELYELWPPGRDPNNFIASQRPIFETLTQQTGYVYGPSDPALIPGRSYALRVQAQDIDGKDLFINKGYSEAIVFTYGEDCVPPTDIQAEAINASSIRVSWETADPATAYKVRYREAGDPSAQWFEEQTLVNELTVGSLKASTLYEFSVEALCGNELSLPGPDDTASTAAAEQNVFACQAVPASSISNKAPKSALQKGDRIRAGDFNIELTTVSGGNGRFSGEGVVVIPLMSNVRLRAVFESIGVNTDNQLIEGSIAISGAALQLVPEDIRDAVNEGLDQVDDALDDAEQAARQAEEALEKAEDILNTAAEYLPEETYDRLVNARSGLTSAKEHAKATKNNPDATPEEVGEAEEQLKEARQEMNAAYGEAAEYAGEALSRFVHIAWEAIGELKEEYQKTAQAEEAYRQAREEVEKAVYADQGISPPIAEAGTDAGDEDLFLIGELVETGGEEGQDEGFLEKVAVYRKARTHFHTVQLLNALFEYYASEGKVLSDLSGDQALNGEELLESIAERLRDGESDEAIIGFVKEEILKAVETVAENSK